MQILTPLNSLAEIDSLVEAGADEFYAGYVSPEWLNSYSILTSPNRRDFLAASFTDFSDLASAAKLLQKNKKPLYITVNRAFYSASQYPMLLKEIRSFIDIGVAGLIVADLELLLLIRENSLEVPIHLSSLAPVLNADTASFYKQFGVSRITLPRSLTTEEVNLITLANPTLGFDVFIFGGKCVNIEGYCNFFHVNAERRWPCVQSYSVMSQSRVDKKIVEAELSWLDCPRYLACGLCALDGLATARVTGLKVVGRGARLDNKLLAVRLIKRGLSYLELDQRENFSRKMAALYQESFDRKCEPHLCYSPYEVRK